MFFVQEITPWYTKELSEMAIKYIIKILLKPKFIFWQILGLLLQITATGISVATPLLASIALDRYFSQGHLGNDEFIIAFALLFSTLIIPPISSWLNVFLGENISRELKENLMNKTLNFSSGKIIKENPAKLYTLITNDVGVVKDMLIQTVPTVVMSIILLAGSVFFMYQINSRLSIIIVIVVPIIASFVVIIFRTLTKYFKKGQEIKDSTNKIIDENIKASMLIRVFASEKREMFKFDVVNTKQYKNSLEIVKRISIAFPLLNITMYVGQLLVLLVGGIESMNGRLSVGGISAFNNYVIMFTTPFLLLSFTSTLIGQSIASINRIGLVLGEKDKVSGASKLVDKFQNIKLNFFNLLINSKEILHSINFELNKGEKVGIIGLTGAGKSVFIDALMNFFDEHTGKYLINGDEIETVNFSKFRTQVGYVPQKNFILSGSLYNNIDFYRNIPRDEIVKASKVAMIKEFSDKYQDDLGHRIDEHGGNLSGGQKQRITIARALAGDPQILILDDSTSNLDMETESQLMNNIKVGYPDLTMLIVAQKIASIKDCDRIYVMENGSFEAVGTHKELMDRSLLYREIDLAQSNYDRP